MDDARGHGRLWTSARPGGAAQCLPLLRCAHGLGEQHGDGHRADPAGHGGDQAGALGRGAEGDVADVARVVAGVDHDRAGLDPLAPDQLGPTDGRDHDVGLGHELGQPAGLGVADGDGGVAAEQQHRGGLAEDRTAADHHHVLAGDGHLVGVQQRDDAGRRAGREGLLVAVRHVQERVGGDAVDVLAPADRVEHGALVDVRRHRVLDQDAVHAVVGDQIVDGLHHLGGGALRGQIAPQRVDADLTTAVHLHPHVGVRGGVVADQHGGEPRRPPGRLAVGAHPRRGCRPGIVARRQSPSIRAAGIPGVLLRQRSTQAGDALESCFPVVPHLRQSRRQRTTGGSSGAKT